MLCFFTCLIVAIPSAPSGYFHLGTIILLFHFDVKSYAWLALTIHEPSGNSLGSFFDVGLV
jgi:hypothetical protein